MDIFRGRLPSPHNNVHVLRNLREDKLPECGLSRVEANGAFSASASLASGTVCERDAHPDLGWSYTPAQIAKNLQEVNWGRHLVYPS